MNKEVSKKYMLQIKKGKWVDLFDDDKIKNLERWFGNHPNKSYRIIDKKGKVIKSYTPESKNRWDYL